ncbi:MAG TPA: hypothetical protein PLV92_19380, partial [Pirellulaceae bacterium]|nr:hypothetical protein [Pirellulaceae bacterium]
MAKTPAAPPATPSQPPKFKTVVLPDAIRFVQAFSEDRQAGTLIFDNFVAGTAAGRGSLPGAELKKFTYVLQPDADKTARVRQVIRGYVSTVGSGSAALVVHSGGTTTLVDLAKAIKAAKSSKNAPAKSVEATRAQARAAAATLGFS